MSRYALGLGVAIPQFDKLRADVRRWGWMRGLLVQVMSVLRRYARLFEQA